MGSTSYDKIYDRYRINYDLHAFANVMSEYVNNSYAAEASGSTGISLGSLILSVLKRIIEFLGDLITNIRKWFGDMKSALKKNIKGIFDARGAKRNAIQTEIYNIDIQIKALRKDTTKDDVEKAALIDSLLNRRAELMDKYEWLGDNFYVSNEHYRLFQDGYRIATEGIEHTMSIFQEFNAELTAYQYIPLLQDIEASNIERAKVNVHNKDEGIIGSYINDQVANASAAAKAGGAQYQKVWGENDPEYNEYVTMIDQYSNGYWKSENIANLQRLHELKARITEVKTDGLIREDVVAVKKSTIHRMNELDDRDLAKSIEIEKALKFYKSICEREYKRAGKLIDIRRRGVGFTIKNKKAPEYLLKTINTLTEMVNNYKGFCSHRASLVMSISTVV